MGRIRKRFGESNDTLVERIELRLSESDIRKLDEIAKTDGVTRSACIRGLIDTQYFFRREEIEKRRKNGMKS